ncbi:11403_t:CDS:2 [Gigaspora rosea]|nr:11403_t:CDS:2 [Gigaspora rosea]
MNGINLFLFVLIHTLLAQTGSDFSTCLSSSTVFSNTLPGGLPGDECGGIIGTTSPTNTTVGRSSSTSSGSTTGSSGSISSGTSGISQKETRTKIDMETRMRRGLPTKKPIHGVKHIIAVASGKGGVGKSTLAINLALAIASFRHRVGILDADVFGPSIPRLLNLKAEPQTNEKGDLIPLANFGVKAMSMGFLVGEDLPIVWRGLMETLQQLLHQVQWGELDLLVIDMPPGTGDTQLTISQQIVLDGVVIVSTPQDIALVDARKGANMFTKHKVHIFGQNGVLKTSKEMGLDYLGDIPLDADICELSDFGTPVVVTKPDSFNAQCYKEVAKKIMNKINLKN